MAQVTPRLDIRMEGPCGVTLPVKGPPRDRWLTRSEAAKLIWACTRTSVEAVSPASKLPSDNQGEKRATIRMRMAPGVG